eukprot:m.22087 g.22087  ORF g.22087 m.22087 type:complete len:122 (-) comp3953_c0_seq2:267-632(-)
MARGVVDDETGEDAAVVASVTTPGGVVVLDCAVTTHANAITRAAAPAVTIVGFRVNMSPDQRIEATEEKRLQARAVPRALRRPAATMWGCLNHANGATPNGGLHTSLRRLRVPPTKRASRQ